MPQRFLRPGIVTSVRLARCSPWAQLLYYKLISLVDDYSRYDAHPLEVGRQAFPYGDDRGRNFKDSQIEAMLVELETARLNDQDEPCLTRYQVNGKLCLLLHRWTERLKFQNGKYPGSRYPSPELDAKVWEKLSKDVKERQQLSSPSSSSPSSYDHANGGAPSDARVFEEAEQWPGEPGVPPIPRAFVVEWIATMAGRTRGWPGDWPRKLIADWRQVCAVGKGKKNGARERWQIEKDLNDVREQLRTHAKTTWPANKPLPEKIRLDFDALVERRKALEQELAHE